MKHMKLFARYSGMALMLSAILSHGAYSQSEREGGNGGGPDLARAYKIERLKVEFEERVKTKLQKRVLKYLRWASANLDKVMTREARIALKDMLDRGLYQDVMDSKYVVLKNEACIDIDGVPRAASSRMNDRGGDICFSALELAKSRVSEEELISLALHEYSHHFGYVDANHALMAVLEEHVALFLELARIVEADLAKRRIDRLVRFDANSPEPLILELTACYKRKKRPNVYGLTGAWLFTRGETEEAWRNSRKERHHGIIDIDHKRSGKCTHHRLSLTRNPSEWSFRTLVAEMLTALESDTLSIVITQGGKELPGSRTAKGVDGTPRMNSSDYWQVIYKFIPDVGRRVY